MRHITWTAMIQMEFDPFGLLTSRSARTTEVCILLLQQFEDKIIL
jgi:hypothetical protein